MTRTLLEKVDALTEWTMRTSGACLGGRAMATDDPETLGWDVIRGHLDDDGVFVFRHIPVGDVAGLAEQVEALGCALHTWRIFHGTVDEIGARRKHKRSPDEYKINVAPTPNADTVSEVSGFLADRGLKPFTPRILSGQVSPSALVTARSPAGRLTAVAFGHFPFNAPSRWDETGWCGLVAVDADARGTGLGRAVNDAAVDAMLHQHGATAVVEYVAEDNLASRRMIEGSGLQLREDILTCAATNGSTPYTR